ncbi:response regulator transcription factor [Telmatospirillum sp. J64-1]|uniref:response regulator n=1 Tax=Telmatospirillum sp. J64-1 TaxID=2502183 RepID=UPI00115DEB99|nr:response regulator transcription factor [Telmatospirillum sp. J64-1]
MRVIFADDHAMIRESLRPFVQAIAEDVEIVEAGSGHEVCRLLEADPRYDLALLDLRMPGMNGLTGLEHLRQRFPDLRIVVLSAVVDRDQVNEILELGVAGYVPKHLSTAQMKVALQLVLTGERFIPSLVFETPDQQQTRTDSSFPPAGLLTPREREVARMLRDGLPNKLIAARMGVAEVTVKTHVISIFRKLGVQNRSQAVRRYFSACFEH